MASEGGATGERHQHRNGTGTELEQLTARSGLGLMGIRYVALVGTHCDVFLEHHLRHSIPFAHGLPEKAVFEQSD
jgi:hypothetical protein